MMKFCINDIYDDILLSKSKVLLEPKIQDFREFFSDFTHFDVSSEVFLYLSLTIIKMIKNGQKSNLVTLAKDYLVNLV